jgi:hypothetical protein
MTMAREMVSDRSQVGSRPPSPHLLLTSLCPVRLSIRAKAAGTATSRTCRAGGKKDRFVRSATLDVHEQVCRIAGEQRAYHYVLTLSACSKPWSQTEYYCTVPEQTRVADHVSSPTQCMCAQSLHSARRLFLVAWQCPVKSIRPKTASGRLAVETSQRGSL